MNYYLISFGHSRDTRSERNYLVDGGSEAILVRADDHNEAEQIARSQLVVVAPAEVRAHLVARVLNDTQTPHLDAVRAANSVAVSMPVFAKVDADLADEAGMDGNYQRMLQAARTLDS